MKYYIIYFLFFFTSCMDIFVSEHKIIGEYYIASDPSISCKSLFNGNFDRIKCIDKAGEAKGYIFVQIGNKFKFINTNKDQEIDLGSPGIKENISKLLTESEFKSCLDSLQIKNFEFTYEK